MVHPCPGVTNSLHRVESALYEGDDAEWLDELRGEERMAASSQFVQRLKNLADSGRVTEDEYRELFQCLL